MMFITLLVAVLLAYASAANILGADYHTPAITEEFVNEINVII